MDNSHLDIDPAEFHSANPGNCLNNRGHFYKAKVSPMNRICQVAGPEGSHVRSRAVLPPGLLTFPVFARLRSPVLCYCDRTRLAALTFSTTSFHAIGASCIA